MLNWSPKRRSHCSLGFIVGLGVALSTILFGGRVDVGVCEGLRVAVGFGVGRISRPSIKMSVIMEIV